MKRIAMLVLACALTLGATVGCSWLCCDPCDPGASPCDPCASPCAPAPCNPCDPCAR